MIVSFRHMLLARVKTCTRMLMIMLNVYHSPWTRHTIPQFKIYRAIISGIFEIFTKLSQTVSIYLMNYDQNLLPLISCSTVIKIIIQRKSVLWETWYLFPVFFFSHVLVVSYTAYLYKSCLFIPECSCKLIWHYLANIIIHIVHHLTFKINIFCLHIF